ncbi:NosD domain-containing protein [Lentimicrobium sp.]|uniref:NosD domain-containing protein n=2 Tax=Lentimicrobium sp. TaxID=2034841 RepID=UPI002D14412A|nr:NosD domain-containing protein [Lentimicrobium sp.]HPJ63052.1 NosD domain-containing protein [Lentimicrobium sp.]
MNYRIRRFCFISLFIFLAGLRPLVAQEYVGGLISENTVYTPALNPYIVIEPLIVPEGITLTIMPGTELYFMIRTSLRIEGGTLLAEGTPENQILFDAHNPSGEADKKWDGINLFVSRTVVDEDGNYLGGNLIRHALIRQTTTALVLSDTALIHAPDTRIMNSDYGVYLQSGASLVLRNSVIDACSYGMYIKNSGDNIISGCQITNCDIGIFFPSNNISRNNLIIDNNLSFNRNIALFMSIGQGNIQHNLIAGNTVAFNNIGLHIGNGGTNDPGYNNINNNVIRNNDIGLKLSQDADTVKGNLIELNETGLMLSKAAVSSIEGNTIRLNTGWGMLMTDGSNSNLIKGNNIYDNAAGIRVTHKDFKYSVNNLFEFNMVSGNAEEAFLFEAGPQLGIHNNSIQGVRDTAIVVNRFETDLHAEGNYWFTSDTLVIDSLIYDMFDQPELGEVIYKPFLDQPDPVVPISRPRMVVKRQVGPDVLVNWLPNAESDLAGYMVYYGLNPDGSFSYVADAGSDTLFVISGYNLSEAIAVTACDVDADGVRDQAEGHESAYSFAVAGPWAGGDAAICEDTYFLTESATAVDYQSLFWETGGDGAFADPQALSTRYVPGPADIASGSVTLTLGIATSAYTLYDRMLLSIMGQPSVFAGNDTTVSPESGYYSNAATASDYSGLYWTTSGDGTFDDPSQLLTHYYPGVSDIENGSVVLSLHLQSECGDVSDEVVLMVKPAFSISGSLLHESGPVAGGVVLAMSREEAGTRAVALAHSAEDGKFIFEELPAGTYYLFALGEPTMYNGFLPSYYASGSFWQPAYLLPLDSDVYDIDIRLQRLGDVIQPGTGSISGVYTYLGDAGRDADVYNESWFDPAGPPASQPGYLPASNHVVYLMNTSLTHVIRWALTDMEGNFTFESLPFGTYRLWGEKAGYTNALSPLIALSPLNPDAGGVVMSVNNQKISIQVPDPARDIDNVPFLYPNPAGDIVWINLPWSENPVRYELEIYSSAGLKVLSASFSSGFSAIKRSVDVAGLAAGIYPCLLRDDTGNIRFMILNVAR